MNVDVKLCKSDVKDAYRILPMLVAHIPFAGIVFEHDDDTWVSYRKSMPFGAVSSCHGWHQISTVVCSVAQGAACPYIGVRR